MDKTGIEWTDATWNPIRGCTRVSEGCRNCYAEKMAARFCWPEEFEPEGHIITKREGPYRRVIENGKWNGKIQFIEDKLDQPLRWKKPRKIFVNSMSDLFHNNVMDEWLLRIFDVIRRGQNNGHVFQILTKRPLRMSDFAHRLRFDGSSPPHMWLAEDKRESGFRLMAALENVWLGTSVEDQKSKYRIDILRDTPASIRFLSIEPMLEDLGKLNLKGIHWVIVGGESGPGSRSMNPDWVRNIRDQCVQSKVPFLFKQWGEYRPISLRNGEDMEKVGKKIAGRVLDGKTWDGYPGDIFKGIVVERK